MKLNLKKFSGVTAGILLCLSPLQADAKTITNPDEAHRSFTGQSCALPTGK